jgi:PQQ-dependent catabolism-associated CXXCW motif protein
MPRRHAPLARLLVLAVAVLLVGPAVAADGLFNDAGYRIDRYRAPVGAAPAGVVPVTTDEVRRLRAEGAHLIDTVKLERTQLAGAPPRWLPNEERMNIPGSVWLPNVGRGELDAVEQAYFERELEDLTGGDVETPLVFYCKADCWMSWNASKRAAARGFARVYWYDGGSDAWRDAGFELVLGEPLPLDPERE